MYRLCLFQSESFHLCHVTELLRGNQVNFVCKMGGNGCAIMKML